MNGDGHAAAIYMVERYWPGVTEQSLRAAARRATEAAQGMNGEGRPVQYLRSTLIPDEEFAFCLFAGRSAEDVAEVNRRAEIPFERIAEAVHFAAEDLRRVGRTSP